MQFFYNVKIPGNMLPRQGIRASLNIFQHDGYRGDHHPAALKKMEIKEPVLTKGR